MSYYTVIYKGIELKIDIYPKEKIEELKERIRVGNKKLEEAWAAIVKIERPSEEWNKMTDDWHLATARLMEYCTQLQGMGFEDCLYLKDGLKTKKCLDSMMSCLACPSKIPYWEPELMGLPSAGTQGKMV